ncbi:hypothetical protein [Thalassoporum mexicanum]|nr:hypothetical protein [Pseudanabaena sp. PCC 7367]
MVINLVLWCSGVLVLGNIFAIGRLIMALCPGIKTRLGSIS